MQQLITELLQEMDSPEGLTAAMVEAFMLLQYGKLSHLSRSKFVKETQMCVDEARRDPSFVSEM